MKFSASLLVTAAALGVSAHPSGVHQHAHRLAHRSLDERAEFIKYQKPEPTVEAPAPAPTEEAKKEEPKPQPEVKAQVFKEQPKEDKKKDDDKKDDDSSSSGGNGIGPSTYTEFCGGNSYSKRATIAEIAYTGNLGTDGDYGCNMMLVKDNIASEYKYQVKIENVLDKEQECHAYLKIGPTGDINGFFKGNQALTFNVPAKGTQYLVADENTQGGVVCDVGKVPTANFGEWASTWAEFDFGNTSNDGWSGADASCLVSSRQGLPIPGLRICGHDTCSTIWPGGEGDNAFTEGMEAEDGWGLNIPAGPAKLNVEIGYQG